MVKRVLKRDGRHVEFNNQKIVAAILKAMDVTEAGEDIVLAAQIAHAISTIDKEEMTVEEIQDVVENQLMNSPRQEVAKEYIRYRNKRNMARKAKTNEIFQTIIDAQVNDITRENANMNADTPAGMMMKFASEATKSYVDEVLLSDPVREAVANNYIHIHDKDYYPTKSLTCIQHPLDKILEFGLKAGHGESRPAKRIETASVLACISMETVQNEMHGPSRRRWTRSATCSTPTTATSRRPTSTITSSMTSSACRAATAPSSTPSTRRWAACTRPWRRSCTT